MKGVKILSDNNDFYQRVLKLCEKNNLSVTAFEKNSGLAASTVSHWKKKANPSLDNLKTVAAYFGVSVDYLVYGRQAKFEDEKE